MNFSSSNLDFRATHTFSKEKMFFGSEDQAKQWITENPDWILQCCQEISWSFPLDQIVKETCWVNI